MTSVLYKALDELDYYLSSNNLSIEIVICGASRYNFTDSREKKTLKISIP
jgi:hypothetical protein